MMQLMAVLLLLQELLVLHFVMILHLHQFNKVARRDAKDNIGTSHCSIFAPGSAVAAVLVFIGSTRTTSPGCR